VVEHEDLLLGAGLDHQLVVLLREVDALVVEGLRLERFKTDHHFDLLLAVQAAAGYSHLRTMRISIYYKVGVDSKKQFRPKGARPKRK
jgi:hypothetical protein